VVCICAGGSWCVPLESSRDAWLVVGGEWCEKYTVHDSHMVRLGLQGDAWDGMQMEVFAKAPYFNRYEGAHILKLGCHQFKPFSDNGQVYRSSL